LATIYVVKKMAYNLPPQTLTWHVPCEFGFFTQLQMSEEDLLIGDDAAPGEEAYAFWGGGEFCMT
jgi:hypothetical protein